MDAVQVLAAHEGTEESHHVYCELHTPHKAPGAGTAACLGETDRVNREEPQHLCCSVQTTSMLRLTSVSHSHTVHPVQKNKARSPEVTGRVPLSRLHTPKPHGSTGTFSRAVIPAVPPASPGSSSGTDPAAITGTPGAPAARPRECYSESIYTA